MEKVLYALADVAIPGIIIVACLVYLVSGISITTDVNGTTETKTGIYDVLGTVPTIEEADDNIHVTPDAVGNTSSAEPPKVTYNNTVIKTWNFISLKSLFQITVNGISYIGTDEASGGFCIVLEDVANYDNVSILTQADYDITEEMEEITITMLHNTSDDTLMFCEAGIYKIRIKVTDSNGKVVNTTIMVPVEPSYTT